VGQHQVNACRVVGRRNLQAVEQQRKAAAAGSRTEQTGILTGISS
jgi:hypothetical protein